MPIIAKGAIPNPTIPNGNSKKNINISSPHVNKAVPHPAKNIAKEYSMYITS